MNKKSLIAEHVKDVNDFSETYFKTFESQDTKALSATLDSLLQDPGFKEVFLKKNREKLNEYGQPLFQKLKNGYGITHFYFILPDNTIFLRLHEPNIFGDTVKRKTFLQAVETNDIGFGLELGKTAFALRVVKPYFNNGELIGYIELGQEIDHFLATLNEETNNDYAIFVDKSNLNRESWLSYRKNNNLTDNWDKYKEHILINDTLANNANNNIDLCFSELNAKEIYSSEYTSVLSINSNDNKYSCSGFVFNDASGQKIGSVLISHDLSREINIINKFILWNSLFFIFLLIITYIFFLTFSRINQKSIEKYKKLFNLSQDAILIIDTSNYSISDCNPAAIDMFGLNEINELKKITLLDVSSKHQLEGILSSIKLKECFRYTHLSLLILAFHWAFFQLNHNAQDCCNIYSTFLI